MLHLHEPFAPGVTLSTVVMHPAPIVGTFHAAGRSSSYRWFHPVLERLMDRIDHKVVVSTEARRLLDEHFPAQAYDVLFNGVDTATIRAARPAPRSTPAIFFLGRHEERKGLEVLLAALEGLPADVRCWVAGHGPDTGRLMQLTAGDPRVEWLGRVSDAEKNARLRGASVFCAPSLHGESFGVVLIEAMAAGTPVVASGLDGYRQVATDGVDALLVPPGDVDALTAALRRVLDDQALAAGLVAAGSARAEEFAMASLADRYVSIYRSLRGS